MQHAYLLELDGKKYEGIWESRPLEKMIEDAIKALESDEAQYFHLRNGNELFLSPEQLTRTVLQIEKQ